MYFTEDYKITYNRAKMPDHYLFVVDSRLDNIESHYRRLAEGWPNAEEPAVSTEELAKTVTDIINSMDSRGAWLEPGWVRDREGKKVVPPDGIVLSRTFIDNVETLCRFIRLTD